MLRQHRLKRRLAGIPQNTPAFERYLVLIRGRFHPATTEIRTKPLSGGSLKLVFIGQTNNCYDLAEVQK
jgi:hypothetical protein